MSVIEPMEALLAEHLPEGPDWQYEPKWDGFRCIAIRDGETVDLWSKSGKPLSRYFPEIEAMLAGRKTKRFAIDGELLIEQGGTIAFDALQLRLHPAESRVRKLADATPAMFMAFDCLAIEGKPLEDEPLERRRAALEKMVAKERDPRLLLSPATSNRKEALAWLDRSGGALDGVIAKRLDEPYRRGERAMVKVKQRRTADCVVGGFRYAAKGGEVGSLLLGLYDDDGLLNHVGFTSSIVAKDKLAWTRELEKLVELPGFTGRAPGGASRWAPARSTEWRPLRPEVVVEVLYDQVTGDRFRHGTKLLGRRPDKAPRQCRMDQLCHALSPAELEQLFK